MLQRSSPIMIKVLSVKERRVPNMGFFDRFRKKPSPQAELKISAAAQTTPPAPVQPKVDFERAISAEEKEIAAVIASAIAAGSHPDSSFRVKSVTGIDTDKEVAAAIVAAIAAGDHPDSHFRLVSITEIP